MGIRGFRTNPRKLVPAKSLSSTNPREKNRNPRNKRCLSK